MKDLTYTISCGLPLEVGGVILPILRKILRNHINCGEVLMEGIIMIFKKDGVRYELITGLFLEVIPGSLFFILVSSFLFFLCL